MEIAASSVAIDLHAKKQAYRRNGVKKYIVWQVLDIPTAGYANALPLTKLELNPTQNQAKHPHQIPLSEKLKPLHLYLDDIFLPA